MQQQYTADIVFDGKKRGICSMRRFEQVKGIFRDR